MRRTVPMATGCGGGNTPPWDDETARTMTSRTSGIQSQRSCRAVFLDRDGVINVDKGYVWRIEDFVFIRGAIDALRQFQAAGYLIIVLTNQSGIARGLYTEDDFRTITKHMLDVLSAEGVNVTGVYYCPHLSDAPVAAFRATCDCRKPFPGMILTAIDTWSIDPSRSILIGDKATDIDAGRAAHIGSCYLVTDGTSHDRQSTTPPDKVFSSLAEAAQVVLH